VLYHRHRKHCLESPQSQDWLDGLAARSFGALCSWSKPPYIDHSRFSDYAQVERAFTVYTKKPSPTARDLPPFKKENWKDSVDGYMNDAKTLPEKYRVLVLARLSSTGSAVTVKQEPDPRTRPSAPAATVHTTRGKLFVPSSDAESAENNENSGASENEASSATSEEDSDASEESDDDGASAGTGDSDGSGADEDSESDDSGADEDVEGGSASEDDDSSRSENTDGSDASEEDIGSTARATVA
jgi:hypothetical protein